MTPPVERIIVGRVATLAATGFGWVEAIAIGSGRIIAAGSAADVEALSGPETETWRLPDGQLVMPSLTDAHLHLVSAAISAEQPDLGGLDRDGVIRAISDIHEERLADGD